MPHDYSSAQVNLDGDAADAIRKIAKSIPDHHLADDGRENEPHVTVKYGLHTSDANDLRSILSNEPPIKLKLGKTSLFPPNEEDGFEVVKADVDSEDLRRLNKKIAKRLKHTDSHPEYHPHATIAYVKIGKGKLYSGNPSASGKEMTADKIVFSSKTGEKTPVYLNGGRFGAGRYRKEED